MKDINEEDLSLLKNEIYKTTIMLNEISEISKKDKKELEESLEDISHQLKTPLTSILIIFMITLLVSILKRSILTIIFHP